MVPSTKGPGKGVNFPSFDSPLNLTPGLTDRQRPKAPAGHLHLTPPPHVLLLLNVRQLSVLCHFDSSKIRLHLVFLGQALVQHSYHFSVPDLIFSLPPNSIFQQIIPAAREASPEHRQQAAFLCGTRCSSHPPSPSPSRRPPPPFPQRGATGIHGGPPAPSPRELPRRAFRQPTNATRGAAAPPASPALQRVSAPLGIAPAAPHSAGGGPTRWRQAHRHAHTHLALLLPPPAPPPGNSDTQRRLGAPRAPAGRVFPAFVPPSLLVTSMTSEGCPTLARCHRL